MLDTVVQRMSLITDLPAAPRQVSESRRDQ